MSKRSLSVILAVAVLAIGCAAPDRQGQSSSPHERTSGPPKRVTAVVEGEHPLVISKIEKAFPGAEAIEGAVARAS